MNYSHLKVLIKKDILTLWRSIGFLITFLVIPLILMMMFLYLESIVDQGKQSGNLINDYFRYTSTFPLPFSLQFFNYKAADQQRLYISSLKQGCSFLNKNNYHYTKIAVVSAN